MQLEGFNSSNIRVCDLDKAATVISRKNVEEAETSPLSSGGGEAEIDLAASWGYDFVVVAPCLTSDDDVSRFAGGGSEEFYVRVTSSSQLRLSSLLQIESVTYLPVASFL